MIMVSVIAGADSTSRLLLPSSSNICLYSETTMRDVVQFCKSISNVF